MHVCVTRKSEWPMELPQIWCADCQSSATEGALPENMSDPSSENATIIAR